MSKLNAKSRAKIPSGNFGLPQSRKYPVEDANHARNALIRVSQQLAKGNISAEDAAKVRAKADAKLGK
jgi:hypothetical protein